MKRLNKEPENSLEQLCDIGYLNKAKLSAYLGIGRHAIYKIFDKKAPNRLTKKQIKNLIRFLDNLIEKANKTRQKLKASIEQMN